MDLFDKSKVTKIYGVEPNRDHHNLLRQRIIKAGLSDVYQIVPVSVEDLNGKGLYGGEQKLGGWIQKGEVDSVVTVQTLCSVQQPKKLIKGLYSYLKPGGMWIVFEHVAMKRGGLLKYYQGKVLLAPHSKLMLTGAALIDIVWPHFMGGCSLTRDTEKSLRDGGHWSSVELEQPSDEPSYKILPNVRGWLIK